MWSISSHQDCATHVEMNEDQQISVSKPEVTDGSNPVWCKHVYKRPRHMKVFPPFPFHKDHLFTKMRMAEVKQLAIDLCDKWLPCLLKSRRYYFGFSHSNFSEDSLEAFVAYVKDILK